MPEFHIHTEEKADILIESLLKGFSIEVESDMTMIEEGYKLMPEYMMRFHGVFLFFRNYGFMVAREEEATSWEDYLFVKLAHYLTAELNGLLHFGEAISPMDATPEKFASFDHYVETAVENEKGMFKQTKKHWLYTHRKRTLR